MKLVGRAIIVDEKRTRNDRETANILNCLRLEIVAPIAFDIQFADAINVRYRGDDLRL